MNIEIIKIEIGGTVIELEKRGDKFVKPAILRNFRGFGSAMKPAWEPVIMAMKPLDGTYADNALRWGVAGLAIDKGRIETAQDEPNARKSKTQNGKTCDGNTYQAITRNGDGWNGNAGRWPSNLILDESAAAALDAASGEHKTGGAYRNSKGGKSQSMAGALGPHEGYRECDGVNASRFFYVAKASRRERGQDNTHPTVKPVELLKYLVRLTATPFGGVVLDPFMGSGTTGVACMLEGRSFVGIEREPEYIAIAEKRIAAARGPLFEACAPAQDCYEQPDLLSVPPSNGNYGKGL
jgi:hypothetical protein